MHHYPSTFSQVDFVKFLKKKFSQNNKSYTNLKFLKK